MLPPTELPGPLRSFAGFTAASERSEPPVVLGHRFQPPQPQSQLVLSFVQKVFLGQNSLEGDHLVLK